LTAIVQTIYYYPRIPNVVASHFDGLGDPNGWSSKVLFFGIYAAVLLLTIFIFLVVPGMVAKSSGRGLKIPNKSYWLAPERQQDTIQFYRIHFLYFGIANLLLVIFVIQLVILANFKDQPRLDSAIVWALILYFIFVALWLIRFYTKFRRKI
ncbi:MAG: DUF1648 domain-containing protein, partial [Gammaproteobacteria bacterium]